jgi:urease accessory protein
MPRDALDAEPQNGERGARVGELARLMVWLSPSFPVGGFSYSHGLESAAADGLVRDRDGLEEWLRVVTTEGSLRNDMILLANAWHGLIDSNSERLIAAAELSTALHPGATRQLEATQQGGSFLAAVRASAPHTLIDAFDRLWSGATGYPVAIGVAAAAHGIGLEATLVAYGTGMISNLTSAAIRLSLIGQTDAQRIIAALADDIAAVARASQNATLDDLGGAQFMVDLAALRHETLYSRLFRS